MSSAWRADLLSDTVTAPTDGMRAAMMTASVGDDVFGEDPTVLALQERVAALLGKEAALFTPSGSMANQLALSLHVGPGQEFIADYLGHVLRAELGLAAVAWGATSRSWPSVRGRLDPAGPLELMVPDGGAYQVSTACIVLENTHNFGGGTVQSLDAMTAVATHARSAGVKIHLDGARLWNAHVASGVALSAYAACADTVSVCLSKGLGAPVGSLLVGSAADMERARVTRKRLGGGMRQVGMLAAAGDYALDHHLGRLADDHRRAKAFAQRVSETAAVVDPEAVETNIVVLDVAAAGWRAPDFVTAAAAEGVRSYAVSPTSVRYVWHLDVDDAGTSAAVEVVTELLRSGPGGPQAGGGSR